MTRTCEGVTVLCGRCPKGSQACGGTESLVDKMACPCTSVSLYSWP